MYPSVSILSRFVARVKVNFAVAIGLPAQHACNEGRASLHFMDLVLVALSQKMLSFFKIHSPASGV